MTPDERKRLKERDDEMLSLVVILKGYITKRAALDRKGTAYLVDTITDALKQCVKGGKQP